MKKCYAKPEVLFESFSMSGSIASCAVRVNFEEGSCGVELTEGISIFTDSESNTVCTMQFEDGSYDGLCYHVPYNSFSVFSS